MTRRRQRTRVLHVLANLNYGGMERLIHELARLSNAASIETHVLTLEPAGRFGRGLDVFAAVHRAPPMERWSLVRPAALSATIRRIAPDVVHTHSGMWYKASLAARLAGVPRLVHTEHGRRQPDPWHDRLLDRLAARRTDIVIAVSGAVALQLKRGIVGEERMVVVPNGVDVDVFRPIRDTRLRVELGLPEDTPIVGSIGRLEPVKGYDVMLDAFAILRERWTSLPQPVLVIAGWGSEAERLTALLKARGHSDGVRILGWRDDIDALHASFTLFTMSSHSEGTSVSLLEAMSAGLCPVVTDVGGNANVLGQELAHRLVPRNDPGALAEAWIRALRNAEQRRVDAQSARARVLAAFNLRKMVTAYETIYRGAPRGQLGSR